MKEEKKKGKKKRDRDGLEAIHAGGCRRIAAVLTEITAGLQLRYCQVTHDPSARSPHPSPRSSERSVNKDTHESEYLVNTFNPLTP